MQEMVVKYNLCLAHDFQINKKWPFCQGYSRAKWAKSGLLGGRTSKFQKIRKSTQEPNCISFRKETALKKSYIRKITRP